MKKLFSVISLIILFSCNKENTESYKVNDHEYITKTDSVNIKVINNDTLKFYYLKNQLRSVTINNFITPEYDTVEDDPFFLEKTYFINQSNEFDAITSVLNNIKKIGVFKENAEYDLIKINWQKVGTIYCYFYDYELMNLDIALTKIDNYKYPKSIKTIYNDSLMTLSIHQEKEIAFYDIKNLEKIKSQPHKSFSFRYLRDIKVVKKGTEKLILAKIIEEEKSEEFYINLKDIVEDIQIAD